MATISPRFDDQGVRIGWQVRIRKRGYPQQVRTFRTKAEAEDWAKVTESEMVRGVFLERTTAERTTVSDVLERYVAEVLPGKRSQQQVRSAAAILAAGLGNRSLASLSPSAIAKYRDARLATGIKGQTVRHELSLLSRILNLAIKEWGISLPQGNPCLQIKMPSPSKARDRRLQGDEEARLLAECSKARNPWLLPVVRFAIETAMRAGEMLETKGTADPETGERPIQTPGLLWKHVDLKKRTATLPMTKNGTARVVPLSSAAVEILRGLPRPLDGRVFGTTYEAIHLSFTRACKRAGIEDLRFHDLRHEATSRLFEKGLNPMQVAAITGHKTLQMLKRYTHLRAEDLARLLG
ncbi:MAG: site-specific integrase [Acidithiobacillus caldus]|uniref:site-specific integrase n=1 Tax=Acidithiobacillus caldus TaxID=33059 RepID=UPI002814F0AF|nr:site-specific integrase [Acidithiobacillus caldus]WMT46591.1 MAG: site-specific integrase [Acidithiobacillus caldus]